MRRAGSLLAAVASVAGSMVVAAAGTLLLGACASCQSTVQSAAVPAIAGASFDGADIDQGTHRVFLADRTDKSVAVIDVAGSRPSLAGSVKMDASPNGLAVAPGRHTVFAALESGDVAVIDTTSLKVVSTIPVATSAADLIDYSPKTNSLYVGTGAAVAVVDLGMGKVTRTISTVSDVEQPRFDPADGLIYTTVPKTTSLVRMDPASGYITGTFVVPKCRPTGLAINPARQLAVMACGSSVAMVDLRSGAQQVTRAVQGGDVVTYDQGANIFVVASPHGAHDSTVGAFGGDGHFIGSVASTPNAHAAVYDEAHGVILAPAAAGLMSFAPAQCAPPPQWVQFAGGLAVFAIPLAALAAFLVWYARRMRRGPRMRSGPTDRELHEEDLEFERERMRAFEDGMFGPEG